MLEAPPGIKRNLQRTYAAWGAAFIAGTPPTNVAGGSPATAAAMVATTLPMPRAVLRAQLLYQLAWLHALVQERRCYTPHGWSVPHDFSAADLRAAAEVVSQAAACSGPEGPDMRRLLGLLATVYGGRLDCAQDGQVGGRVVPHACLAVFAHTYTFKHNSQKPPALLAMLFVWHWVHSAHVIDTSRRRIQDKPNSNCLPDAVGNLSSMRRSVLHPSSCRIAASACRCCWHTWRVHLTLGCSPRCQGRHQRVLLDAATHPADDRCPAQAHCRTGWRTLQHCQSRRRHHSWAYPQTSDVSSHYAADTHCSPHCAALAHPRFEARSGVDVLDSAVNDVVDDVVDDVVAH